jgi:hypothetical protein
MLNDCKMMEKHRNRLGTVNVYDILGCMVGGVEIMRLT